MIAIAQPLSIPFYPQGIPIYDRLGAIQLTKVAYCGTMQIYI